MMTKIIQTSALPGILILGLTAGCLQSNPQGLYERSVKAIARGNYDQGIAGLDQTIQSQPEFAEAYVNRGIAYSQIGKVSEAIADYQNALALNPTLTDAYYNLGNAHMQQKDYDSAIASYNTVIEQDPSSAIAFGNRGKAYRLLGQPQKAIADIEMAAQIFDQQGHSQSAGIARMELAKIKKIETLKNSN